ncbi:YbaK/EbsC family protein [Nocardioides zeae]
MTPPSIGELRSRPALDHLDLVAAPVAAALQAWAAADPVTAGAVGVVEIDPALADTAALTDAHPELHPEMSFNCVLVAGRRDGEERVAACVVRADTRADVNGLVKRSLDVRKCSFLPMERATAESGMEHGGITPVGLPGAWRVLVDERARTAPVAVIGSGLRRSKLLLPGTSLVAVPGAEVVVDLGR